PPAPVQQPTKSATQTPAPGIPAVLPFPAPKDREKESAQHVLKTGFSRFSQRAAAIIPWAVAAAVLLAIPGTVIPVLGIFNRAATTRQDAEVAKRDAASAEAAVGTAREQRGKVLRDAEFNVSVSEQSASNLLNQWTKAMAVAALKATDRDLTVEV